MTYTSVYKYIFFAFALVLTVACERELSDDAELATFSNNPEVFIDGFTGGLEYLPFAGSKFDAFTVDEQTTFEGTAAMRFDVPNVGDPNGAFAGAIFRTAAPRNLTEYDALTFYAKATKAAEINEIGFGQDFGENKFLTTQNNLKLTTGWKKYIIPLPDPSRLEAERGAFWYAEGPENGEGYTFWIDNLQFENLGTVAQPRPAIFNGEEVSRQVFSSASLSITPLTQTFNLANGQNVTVNASPAYYQFASSNTAVATVNELAEIQIVGQGQTEITAVLGNQLAAGKLSIDSQGDFAVAPAPTVDPANVISIFSDAYTNVPVDFYNGFYAPFQTTLSSDFDVNGNAILGYTNFNFVGIEFNQNVPTIDGSAMTTLHFDIYIPGNLDQGSSLRFNLRDFGADGTFDGGDDTIISYEINEDSIPALVPNQWISVDMDITALSTRNTLGQIVLDTEVPNAPRPETVYVDNIYLYN